MGLSALPGCAGERRDATDAILTKHAYPGKRPNNGNWRDRMRNKSIAALLACLLPLLAQVPVGPQQTPSRKPEPFVRYVEGGAVDHSLDDLAPMLHIQRYKGEVVLSSGFTNVSLVFSVYKDGRKIDLPNNVIPDLGEYETNGTIRYSVQIADLDYLPLGGAKKGYCRVKIALQMPDDSCEWIDQDIPKSAIDLSDCSQLSFNERAASDREAPLLWFKTGRNIPLSLVTTDEITSKVKEGSVLILALRFNDQTGRNNTKPKPAHKTSRLTKPAQVSARRSRTP